MTTRPLPEETSIEPHFVALRELFTGPLRSVSFPGIDAATIAELVDETQRRAHAVSAARAAFADAHRELIAAETALMEQQATLTSKGHMAIAYGRVFAQDDGELLAAIDRVQLPKARGAIGPASAVPGAAPARRRGRPPKAVTTDRGPQVALPQAETMPATDEVAAE